MTRVVAEADWAIGVGVAELHQYAGFSGGHKGVSVGCGGRPTITALHHRNRVLAEGVRLGKVQNNPFRWAVDQLGQAAGCRLALAQISDVTWLFGEPVQLIQQAARRCRPWLWLEAPAPGALLRVPQAKACSFYQASRALTYLALMKDELGRDWLEPELFRFGASSLLGDIERQLEHHVTGRYSAAHRHAMG